MQRERESSQYLQTVWVVNFAIYHRKFYVQNVRIRSLRKTFWSNRSKWLKCLSKDPQRHQLIALNQTATWTCVSSEAELKNKRQKLGPTHYASTWMSWKYACSPTHWYPWPACSHQARVMMERHETVQEQAFRGISTRHCSSASQGRCKSGQYHRKHLHDKSLFGHHDLGETPADTFNHRTVILPPSHTSLAVRQPGPEASAHVMNDGTK